MATALSRRLGKRSLLGTRVPADGVPAAAQIPGLRPEPGRAPGGHEDGSCALSVGENGRAPGFPAPPSCLFQVLVASNGQECDQGKGLQGCWRVQDTLQPPAETLQRSVSSNIDVPKRKADAAVEMDEMVAALVLTSLSCSPVVQSPPAGESGLPPPRAAACDPWKESGDVSDSGSSTTSGHWSGASDISTPPHPAGSPKDPGGGEALSSPRRDDGFETDSDPFLPEEPAPRRRKNSVKVMYKCLWPSCGKVLRSIVGIKRHVRTQHLGDGADSEPRKREEDFYYTELQAREEPAPEAATAPSPAATSAPILIQRALEKPEPLLPEPPGPEPGLAGGALSHSAPGSFWHIQADHAYQALPSIQIPVSPHIFTSISWASATSTLPSLSPVRSRSLSFSEPRTPLLKSHLIVASPPRASLGTRKVRGEAKKCRKVYGIEHREQWCTACRWKKACQRFLD
ncbi:ZN395 protein, partial [Oxyruncus cristatus]|nr:ZN395 protein [Oxyruncus cristatus]